MRFPCAGTATERDNSPGSTDFAHHPPATISEHDEVVFAYSVQDPVVGPIVFFDMHRHADGVLRGTTMILYTNAVAMTNSTVTNVF